MKKIIISTIMVVLVAGFATAYPTQHSGNANRHENTMDKSSHGERFTPVSELKELKGELVLKENSFSSIKVSGGEETIITLGASTVESLKLETGSKITVRGIGVPYGMNATDKTVLKVNQLDFNNKTYVVHGGGRHGKSRNDGRNGGGHGYDRNDDRNGGRHLNGGRGNHYNSSVG